MEKDKATVARNARRRTRYAEDAEYRARAIAATRRRYREHNPVRRDTCLGNLEVLKFMGTRRRTCVFGKESWRVTFTVAELARAMNRRPEVVQRWVLKWLFPSPVHWAYEFEPPADQGVYLLDEARALVRIMGEHQSQTPYYMRTHRVTSNKLSDAAVALRRRR